MIEKYKEINEEISHWKLFYRFFDLSPIILLGILFIMFIVSFNCLLGDVRSDYYFRLTIFIEVLILFYFGIVWHEVLRKEYPYLDDKSPQKLRAVQVTEFKKKLLEKYDEKLLKKDALNFCLEWIHNEKNESREVSSWIWNKLAIPMLIGLSLGFFTGMRNFIDNWSEYIETYTVMFKLILISFIFIWVFTRFYEKKLMYLFSKEKRLVYILRNIKLEKDCE